MEHEEVTKSAIKEYVESIGLISFIFIVNEFITTERMIKYAMKLAKEKSFNYNELRCGTMHRGSEFYYVRIEREVRR